MAASDDGACGGKGKLGDGTCWYGFVGAVENGIVGGARCAGTAGLAADDGFEELTGTVAGGKQGGKGGDDCAGGGMEAKMADGGDITEADDNGDIVNTVVCSV